MASTPAKLSSFLWVAITFKLIKTYGNFLIILSFILSNELPWIHFHTPWDISSSIVKTLTSAREFNKTQKYFRLQDNISLIRCIIYVSFYTFRYHLTFHFFLLHSLYNDTGTGFKHSGGRKIQNLWFTYLASISDAIKKLIFVELFWESSWM